MSEQALAKQANKIKDNEDAFAYFKALLLKTGKQIIAQRPENKKRDLFIVVQINGAEERCYCKYRREYYLTFAREFWKLGEKGFGETMNKQHLERATALDCDKLFFIYQNSEVRWCYTEQFRQYAENHNTIRKQKSGEITYAVPISLLNKF